MPEGGSWHRALAYALCGEDLTTLPDRPAPDLPALAAELMAAGWDLARLRRHVQDVRAAGSGWPHAVPDDLCSGLSAAQFAAALRSATAQWGLMAAERRVRRRDTSGPTREDERLTRDIPPHFGKL